MSRFQRLVAIPEHEYNHPKTMEQVTHPLQSQMSSLLTEYQNQGNINDPYTRVQRQGETLDELIKLKERVRNALVQATPRPYQSRAQSLMNFVVDKLDYNEKGELKDDSQAIIPGSNLSDLIQHAVRDRRRNITPVGWEYFRDKLKSLNAPKMALNYETLEEMDTPLSKKPSPASPKTPVKRLSRLPVPTVSSASSKKFAHKPSSAPTKGDSKKYFRPVYTGVTSTPKKSTRVKKEPSYFHLANY